MYLPFSITISYLILSLYYHHPTERLPTFKELKTIGINLLITEICYLFGYFLADIFTDKFSLLRLLGFIILQDVYFYLSHYVLHYFKFNKWHSLHHRYFSPIHAFHEHHIAHFIICICSVAVPFSILNNPKWCLSLMNIVQIWGSVSGHAQNSAHQIHHRDSRKRLGSIYLLDRLLGSY